MAEYRSYLIFVSSLFVVGVVFGVFLYIGVPAFQVDDLENKLNLFFHNNSHTLQEGHHLFWSQMLYYLKLSTMIFLLSLSVIGIPIVLTILFFKGISLGFTVVSLINLYGKKGIFLFLFTVIPQNLIIMPTLILFGISSLAFSIYIFQNRIMSFKGKLKPKVISYTMITLTFFSLFVLASVFEGYVAPHLLDRTISFLKL